MSRVVVLFLGLLIALYVGLFAKLAFDFHTGMRSNRSDLGQIDQSVWNSSQGRFLENTDAGFVATRLTDHVEPILVLIAPVFWLWDDVRALLLLQVLAVAVGIFFVFAIVGAESGLAGCKLYCCVFALVWLLIPQLQHALVTEFHAAPLAVPLILWALWAVERRLLWHFVLATLLVACVKEEMAILAAGLGAWSIYRIGYQARRGEERVQAGEQRYALLRLPHALLLTLFCLLWFVIATFVIVPANAPQVYGTAESVYFQRFPDLGGSPGEIGKTLLSDPGRVWAVVSEPARLDYLWGLFAPLGFLSLLAPELLLFSLPLLLANLLSRYPGQYYNEFHYSAPLMPYVVVSAWLGVRRIQWLGNRLFGRLPFSMPLLNTLLIVWLLGWAGWAYFQQGRGPWGGRYDPTPMAAHHRLLAGFVAQIPADAAVTTTAAVHPHLSHRRYIYQFPLGLDAPVAAQWALLDVTQKTDMAPGDLKNRVEALLAADWRVVDAADGFLLLQKAADQPAPPTIPAAFFDFARGPLPSTPPTQPAITWTGSGVEDWARWRETKLISEWFVAPGADRTNLPWLNAVTPDEATVYASAALPAPAALWYPSSQWREGETIRWSSLSLYLPRTWGLVVPWSGSPRDDVLLTQDGASALVDVYWRDQHHHLVQLSPSLAGAVDWIDQLGPLHGLDLRQVSGCFRLDESAPLCLGAWLRNLSSWPGDQIDVWLQWQGDRWPQELTVFVHLRRAGENQAQADGPPRYFVRYDANRFLQTGGIANDWRWLAVPKTATIGEEWQVVVGLYHQQSGARADVLDAAGNILGNELTIGSVQIGPPPTPDQTCALIEQACASQ